MIEPDYLDKYRPNVGICLFARDGRVWIGERNGVPGTAPGQDSHAWQFPQGGIDAGEDVVEAAFRELHEETGVTSARLLTITPGWLLYDFPDGMRKKKGRNFKGQKQKWVAMLFEGEDGEIDLEVDDEVEFRSWRWAALEEVPSLIVPFKRGVYRELVRAMAPLRDFIRDTAL